MTTGQAAVSDDIDATPPQVRLGALLEGGLAPAIMAIVERGAQKRPALARSLRLVHLMVIPLVAGIPSPINTRGRAALGMVAGGRVRIEGRLGLMRRFLTLIRA